MSEVAPKWTDAELAGDAVGKKDLVAFLHASASNDLLLEHKLNGKPANVAKSAKRPQLLAAYHDLFATRRFRQPDEPSPADLKRDKPEAAAPACADEGRVAEEPKYTKTVTKKGSGDRRPAKGDRVSVFYTGRLEDGSVFDSNVEPRGRKPPTPLVFKVGTGRVIRGWDEAVLTMVRGEKADLCIRPEWAYGQRGLPQAGIPPNATLRFAVELVDIA
ncbi:FK506-binding protein 2B [Coemansia sp. RSA 2711]|nr:FK506-binding protein 2B [Coemansia sp. RSA 2711]KAJ2314181.1 FK506-binding protein 2B [Coemansia sp. RSA 2705]KAJ2321017.1 FK506-binding protein 2B [Coemansia sp. RSA 2704]KAJ2326613.1 FK506-binding protein 2B [Coemansia sp. RSA 2702]KAJ2364457.1 FK506-binding protein 2B [Coemansia sp. RSA 2610]KAJ2389468.1 FK506-binding protein 2B [Coemansia sp. RSA 2611]KAJ2738116.1 FK506-binding protein 2B [Coemansia sp. Cherry 401B]